VLLPLDVLKIKRQVNPEAFRGRGVLRIFAEEGRNLYSGWGWTMARNAPGSFAVRSVLTCLVILRELTLIGAAAVRSVGMDKGRRAGHRRLPQGNLGTELHRVHCRRCCEYYCRCAARYYQDAHPKRQFRGEDERCHRLQRSRPERGCHRAVQGSYTQGAWWMSCSLFRPVCSCKRVFCR